MPKSRTKAMRDDFVRKEVSEILGMFATFQRCYDALDDKSGIDKKLIEYDGFDANDPHETSYYSWGIRLNDRPLNSHFPRLDWYRRLQERWQQSSDPQTLTRNDLIRIAAPARSSK